MQCSERRKTTNNSSSKLHRMARLARIGNKILSVLTVLILLIGSLYCFYCLFDDWRQSQAGLPSQMAKFKPDADDPLSFDELLKLNPDVIGWITIDHTHIDQPIVQGKDDMEYINKSADGSFSLAGAIFLSHLNDPSLTNPYNILYGHHMDNGGMFGDVMKFTDRKYFDSHLNGSILTKSMTEYKLRVFAVLETNATDPYVYSMREVNGEDTSSLVSYLKKHAKIFKDPKNDSPQIFALSTCDSAKTDGRTIVFTEVVKVVKHEK